jgi:hypothetical protein
MRDEPTGLSLDIIDDVLVARVQHHSFRQDLFPIPHQLRIAAAITAESRKVASVALLVRKQQAATRQTGIDWIATGVIAVKFDLNMRRFGRNCDYVLTKRGIRSRNPRHGPDCQCREWLVDASVHMEVHMERRGAATITRLQIRLVESPSATKEQRYVGETFLRRKARQRQDNAMS